MRVLSHVGKLKYINSLNDIELSLHPQSIGIRANYSCVKSNDHVTQYMLCYVFDLSDTRSESNGKLLQWATLLYIF